MSNSRKNDFLTVSGITLLFLVFQIITRYSSPITTISISGIRINNKRNENNVNDHFRFNERTDKQSNIVRVNNDDSSLSIPFLDKINKNWYVSDNTEIRNSEYVRLTNTMLPNSHGSLMSNSLGDNIINDFEVVLRFRMTTKNRNSNNNDEDNVDNYNEGLVLMISPENGFIKDDFHSSYAKRQYELNTNGIQLYNHELMGFPKNLPGLALVIDTNINSDSNGKFQTPFFDAFINKDPSKDYYDLESDGENSNNVWLNEKTQKHIKLKNSIKQGHIAELRLIYLESISFLKVDIKYPEDGDYWVELFQTNEQIFLPKNSKTKERFIGVSALTKNRASYNIDILNIATNEFHYHQDLKITEEEEEKSYDFAKEIQLFLKEEFGNRINMEKDDFIKWALMKSQPNYYFQDSLLNKNTSSDSKDTKTEYIRKIILSFILKPLLFLTIIFVLYIFSAYARVILRHKKKKWINKREILPI